MAPLTLHIVVRPPLLGILCAVTSFDQRLCDDKKISTGKRLHVALKGLMTAQNALTLFAVPKTPISVNAEAI